MYLINRASLDLSNNGLTYRIKNAKAVLKSGAAYNQFIMRASGKVIMLNIDSAGKITQKTLTLNNFRIVEGQSI